MGLYYVRNLYTGYMWIMEKKVETTTSCLGFRVVDV